MSATKIGSGDVLSNHPKLIREQIKDVIKKQTETSGVLENVFQSGPHNARTPIHPDNWQPPYAYVAYIGRRLSEENTDTAKFEYVFTFEIGVIVDSVEADSDTTENRLLEIFNKVESAIVQNETFMNNKVNLFHYPHDVIRNDEGLSAGYKHIAMIAEYTADIELGA